MSVKPKVRARIRWDPDTERQLIEIWADILTETDGLMLTRTKKETGYHEVEQVRG